MSKAHETDKGDSWKNFRRKYWREAARDENTRFLYSEANITRMSHGSAPRRLAKVRCLCHGKEFEMFLSKELHHLFGIKDGIAHCTQTVVECWPHEHAEIDPDRIIKYVFVEWITPQ